MHIFHTNIQSVQMPHFPLHVGVSSLCKVHDLSCLQFKMDLIFLRPFVRDIVYTRPKTSLQMNITSIFFWIRHHLKLLKLKNQKSKICTNSCVPCTLTQGLFKQVIFFKSLKNTFILFVCETNRNASLSKVNRYQLFSFMKREDLFNRNSMVYNTSS